MNRNIYLVKSLSPWMVDELIEFSKYGSFSLLLLRNQDEFYTDSIQELRRRGVRVVQRPFSWSGVIKRSVFGFRFALMNISKFDFSFNGFIGIKGILWFILLDVSNFSKYSNIHAQFATQSALIALLIKRYFDNEPSYSFTFHAHDIYFKNKWFRLLVENCSKSFSISEYNIKYVIDKYINSNKYSLSRLGVRLSEFNNKLVKEDNSIGLRLGLLSWFTEKKGIFYLLSAMLEIKKLGYLDIHLNLAGDGPLKDDIVEFIETNKLIDSVRYIGKLHLNEKDRFFNDIDVFILPSITLDIDKDGIPVVLMEAVANGLPLISTNVSGIPEICLDNYNGILIEEKRVDVIVEAILKMYKNHSLQDTYSLNSKEIVKQYDIQKNSYEKIKMLSWI